MTINLIQPVLSLPLVKLLNRGLVQIPGISPKTLIYTGNELNTMTPQGVMYFGIAKSSVAHFISECGIYSTQNALTYAAGFIIQTSDARMVARLATKFPARGELYLQLAEKKGQFLQYIILSRGEAMWTFQVRTKLQKGTLYSFSQKSCFTERTYLDYHQSVPSDGAD